MSVIKYILNNVFRFNQIKKEDIKSIHIRDVLFVLYIIHITGMMVFFNINDTLKSMSHKTIMIAIFCVVDVFYLCFWCIGDAFILYVIGKYVAKRALRFRECCKVALSIISVDVIGTIIQLAILLVGIQLGTSAKDVLGIGMSVYGVGICTYFLKKFYHYGKRDIAIYSAIYFVLLMIPKVCNYILP